MEKGWIKLHRQIFDCSIWNSREAFDRRSAWIDILLSASHKDVKMLIDGKTTIVPKGSYMFSIEKLSARWSWSRNKVKRFLKLLEDEQMVTTERTNRGTLINVVNYNKFQVTENPSEPPNEPPDEPPNAEKKPEPKRQIFIPPTADEVQAYCEQRQNGIDAQSFVNFYSSKGWMIGKNKMKDWKAAVRTWERTRKQPETHTDRNLIDALRQS